MNSNLELLSQALRNHSSGDINLAEKDYKKLINSGYKDPIVIANLAIILRQKEKFKQALILFKESIKLDPISAGNYNNLGNLLIDLNRLQEAGKAINISLRLLPDSTYNNQNLCRLLTIQKKYTELFKQSITSIELFKDLAFPYHFAAIALANGDLKKFSVFQLKKTLEVLFKRKDIDHKKLFRVINYLVPKDLIYKLSTSNANILSERSSEHITNNLFTVQALRLFVFPSSTWEKVLSTARKNICLKLANREMEIGDEIIDFMISLSIQCFLNEYIYYYTEEESQALEKIISRLISNEQNSNLILLVSCYIPIYSLLERFPSIKKSLSKKIIYEDFLMIHYEEKNIEINLSKRVKKLGDIKDNTSKLVKNQYEVHPYPRWRYADKSPFQAPVIEKINSAISPNKITSTSQSKIKKILIAGCGTGKQIINTSIDKDVEITAIDLSLSSLSYAMRKANEVGINNIKFIQMDILEVELLNEQFDLIECCGVLHHMKSPMEGLKSLLKVIKSGGYLKLAFYSNLARKEIAQVQRQIRSEQIEATQENIIDFRNKYINGYYSQLNMVDPIADFYTASMFRDLFFHVQEHQLNICELKRILNENEIDFLGFILPEEVKLEYKKIFKEDSIQTNLNNWALFEEKYPKTFLGMYQFWSKVRN